MRRAVVLAAGLALDAAAVPAAAFERVPAVLHVHSTLSTGSLSLEEVVADYVRHAVERCGGNKSQAARLLGIDLKTLTSRLRRQRSGS